MHKKSMLGVAVVTMLLIGGAFVALSARSGRSSQTNAVAMTPTGDAPTVIFNRSLKSSSVSWGGCCQTAPAGFFNIDSPLNFTCPGPGTCTVSAEMSVQVGANTTAANRWALAALVDGAYMEEPPAAPYVGELLTDGDYSAAQWTANMSQVPAGHHTLQSQIYTDFGATLANYSIVYRLYKP